MCHGGIVVGLLWHRYGIVVDLFWGGCRLILLCFSLFDGVVGLIIPFYKTPGRLLMPPPNHFFLNIVMGRSKILKNFIPKKRWRAGEW